MQGRLYYFNPMPPLFRKLLHVFLWLTGAVTLILGALFLAVVQPGGSGDLARVRLPDGSGYKISQRCNWSMEPYTVTFFIRSPEDRWEGLYIDHEAMRWRDVAMTWDQPSDCIVVTERGTRRVVLNRRRGTFWFDNGSFSREAALSSITMMPAHPDQ